MRHALPVKLPGKEYPLFLVVVKGFGKKPMMLLTSCPVKIKLKENIWKIVEIYLTRWKCDESFRYIKQCYNLEDIRVRHYTSIIGGTGGSTVIGCCGDPNYCIQL
jgi:hypothetical protein